MKRIVLMIFALYSYCTVLHSQTKLDSLLNSLKNSELYVAPILYNPWEPRKPGNDKDSARINKRLFIVSSLDVDIQEIATIYGRKVVIEKLYGLLSDPTRDLYASALLYDLVENRNLGQYINVTREKWISNGKKTKDIAHWNEYVAKLETLNLEP
jgi:hypothetical protein